MNFDRFYVDNNGCLQLYDVRITERTHSHNYLIKDNDIALEDSYVDNYKYFLKDQVQGYLDRYVSKHKLIEVIKQEEYDNTDFKWMVGIQLRTNNPGAEIPLIYSYGSLEAYQASLPEFADNFMLDLECRVSMMELGLN